MPLQGDEVIALPASPPVTAVSPPRRPRRRGAWRQRLAAWWTALGSDARHLRRLFGFTRPYRTLLLASWLATGCYALAGAMLIELVHSGRLAHDPNSGQLRVLDPTPLPHAFLQESLARLVGRGQRSAIGTWLFGHGGFVLEGGRRGEHGLAPLLAHHPMPPSWHAVVAIPEAAPGLSGDDEARAFQGLPRPSEREVEHIAHLVLMQLLPALVDADLAEFGRALTEVQRITGGWFASHQGGAFAPGAEALIERLRGAGAAGVGQSSWGPTVYAIAPDRESAEELGGVAWEAMERRGQVHISAFVNHGATVTADTTR